MSRYLIIDTEKESIEHGQLLKTLIDHLKRLEVISEEETLSKFYEVWSNGTSVGYGCGKTQSDITEEDWNNIKNDL